MTRDEQNEAMKNIINGINSDQLQPGDEVQYIMKREESGEYKCQLVIKKKGEPVDITDAPFKFENGVQTVEFINHVTGKTLLHLYMVHGFEHTKMGRMIKEGLEKAGVSVDLVGDDEKSDTMKDVRSFVRHKGDDTVH